MGKEGKVDQYDIITKECLITIQQLNAELLVSIESVKNLLTVASGKGQEIWNVKSQNDYNKAAAETNKLIAEASLLNAKEEELLRKKEVQQKKIVDVQEKSSAKQKEQLEIQKLITQGYNRESIEAEKLRKINAELRKQRDGLTRSSKENREEIKRLNSEIDKNTKELNKNADSAVQAKNNIGKYFKDIVKGGLALAGVAIGINTLKNGFLKTVESVQSLSDGWAKFTSGMTEGFNSIFRTIASGEFTMKNLIQNFRDARKAGEEYAEMQDSLGDSMNAQLIIEANAAKKIIELEKTYKNRGKTEAERLAAVKELTKEQEKLEIGRVENKKKALDAEMKLATTASKLTEDQIIDYLKNFKTTEETENKITELYKKRDEEVLKRRGNRGKKGKSEELIAIDNEIAGLKLLFPIYDNVNKLVDKGRGSREAVTKAYYEWKQEAITAEMAVMRAQTIGSAMEKEIKEEKEKNITALRKSKEDELKFQSQFESDMSELEIFFAKETADQRKQINTDVTDFIMTQRKSEHEQYLKDLEERITQEQKFGQLKQETANMAFDFASSLLGRQEELTNRKYDNEIKAAGKNEKLIEEIEKKKANEIAKIQRKMAIVRKAQALMDITIDTARGVASAPKDYGPGAIVAIPLIIASGLIQAGIVLAEPLPEIPKFEKGKKKSDKYSGLGIVHPGEIMEIDGRMFRTPDKPALIDIPVNTEITPREEVNRSLTDINKYEIFGGVNQKKYEQLTIESNKNIEKKLDKVVHAIENKQEYHIHLDNNGIAIATKQSQNWNQYINRKFHRK